MALQLQSLWRIPAAAVSQHVFALLQLNQGFAELQRGLAELEKQVQRFPVENPYCSYDDPCG